jgi:putative membrane protein
MNAAARAAGTLLLAAPLAARAHGGELDWHVAPSQSLLVLVPICIGTALYLHGVLRRASHHGLQPHEAARSLSFSLAVLLLTAALVWPLDAWAELSFAAHMAQHMVLVALAPPLLLLARPAALALRGLPARARPLAVHPRQWPGMAALRGASRSPGGTAALHGALLWAWHLPAAFDFALRNDLVHWLEHVTLLGSALLFWRAVLRARRERVGWALLAMLLTVMHSGMLGALIALAPHPLYAHYAASMGAAAALSDQQLAGLIMWVPMGAAYLAAAAALAARALGPDQRSSGAARRSGWADGIPSGPGPR